MKSLLYLVSTVLLSQMSIAQVADKKEVNMQNKEVIRKLYEEAMNKRNIALLPELISADYDGPDFKQVVTGLTDAFPDAHWKVKDMVAEGNKVVVFQQFQGTHLGTFQHIPATGRGVASNGVVAYELKDGKVIHSETLTDRLGFLQELGVLPRNINGSPDNVIFIDRFTVPNTAVNEFLERVKVNRGLIKTLPGFVRDAAYSYTDNEGKFVFVTVAVWGNKAAFEQARETVQASYKKEGFDMPAMLKRLNITIERGVYKEFMAQ
ncbi:ester cyclase [Chitinophaga ginsengisoli]|uniref:Antibiotic biosynthesis monooxygenase n=1 Tax=Chitinophaga ginsengisoli TaxID=363837 RepID=A0A2P8GPM1_9BACT|nr:ester cyclase [Chitinophaga ginsengisoli]PSL35895.1 antibiotic biosynthesis monooxygenase [Chitinophaga ginsengisoli]